MMKIEIRRTLFQKATFKSYKSFNNFEEPMMDEKKLLKKVYDKFVPQYHMRLLKEEGLINLLGRVHC